MPKVPKIDYVKCKQCRKDRQKCLPKGRTWPANRCDRCEKYNYRCSENLTKAAENVASGAENTVEVLAGHLEVLVGSPSGSLRDASGIQSSPLDPVPLGKRTRGLNECLEELGYLEWILHKWKREYERFQKLRLWYSAPQSESDAAKMIMDTYSVYQEVFLEVVNVNLTSAEDDMMEVSPSRIISHHFMCHTAWLQSINSPEKNFYISLSKVIATLSKKGDFLAAQVLQERVLGIMMTASKGSTTDAGHIAEAVQTLVDLYQKSSVRTQSLFAGLGLKIPSMFLIAPFLDQAISQNNQLLTSVALSQLYLDRPESHDIAGRTVFHFAAESNADASLEVLFRTGMDFDERDVNRETPLHYAARKGHLRVVRMLLGDCLTDVGSSLEYSGERTGSQVAAKERAISKPVDINVGPSYIARRTALQAAEVVGHQDGVKHLTPKSVDINTVAAEDNGRTALQAAAEQGHLEVVKFLIYKSANVNAVPASLRGRTALQAAAENNHLEVVRFLISKSADVNAVPAMLRGRTALQAAAEQGHLEVVKFLISKSADVNATDYNGRTALEGATNWRHHDVVELLLFHGATH